MKRFKLFCLGLASAALVFGLSPQSASAQRRGGRGGPTPGVYKDRVTPNWFDNNTKFWYRNDLKAMAHEFILVDTATGTRAPAFDHQKLADALSGVGSVKYTADHLPFTAIEFINDDKAIRFTVANETWVCDLSTYALTKAPAAASATPIPDANPIGADTDKEALAELDPVAEKLADPLHLLADPFGFGSAPNIDDYHPELMEPQQAQGTTPAGQPPTPPAGGRGRGGRGGGARAATSADGKFVATVVNNNINLHSNDTGKDTPITTDGTATLPYANLQWSPDSTSLVAWRVEQGDHKVVYFVESSPPAGGRTILHTNPYAQAGDKLDSYELNLFNVSTLKQTKPAVDKLDMSPDGGDPTPGITWNPDGYHFSYEKVDRGHQRLRLIQVDAHTGEFNNVIDEKSNTFIWTAHTEALHGPNGTLPLINYLPGNNEVIYVSEMDGWRQLYLVDMKTGTMKQITKGNWVLRGVDRIDADNRQIWFNLSGYYPDQDPYLHHFARVNFDGTGMTILTEGNGDHTITYSPDRKFIIDSYSRVDMPPVNELRRISDGKLVTKLEEADINDLKATGWQAPEVFVAKGRDGKTDIWGIIARPANLDPTQKYPVLEDIYNGPQDAYVPKGFSAARRFANLTNLGFIVVQCDAMGTAMRSKAFHDVCWKNLGDAGFPDRIAWQKAIGAKYSYYDLDRAGIYGTSAGGQNAAGAVLFHPEFYKVAVANSGCHDNRIDKISWNEEWMGYPVGPQYAASSNIDNAAKLGGFLQLVVGEMDTNVPPESTFRFVDALIKANKDFELVVVPGANHGAASQITGRKQSDFFQLHLQGINAPNRNARALQQG